MQLRMLLSVLVACLTGPAANAQENTLTGSGAKTTEASVPTGSYVSYTTTLTEPSGSGLLTSMGSTRAEPSAMGTANASDTTSSSAEPTIIQGTIASTSSANVASGPSASNSSSLVPPPNTQGCNLFPEFCNRTYSNVTEVCAHNSMFDMGGNAASNQELDVTAQLNDGIRMLQGQTHLVNGSLRFCHTSCDLLDAGPVVDYLTKVRSWVQKHPYDVVTILLANGDYSDVNNFTGPIHDSGLMDYAYVPPKVPMGIQDWPTLGNMILQGKRVVFFMDYQANQTAVPYILDEFSQIWETPFDPTDDTFPCTVQRPPHQTDEQREERLYLLNHNLNQNIDLLGVNISVPNTVLLPVTNNVTGQGSLGMTTNSCTAMYDRPPKFLLVDYYNRDNGTVFEVAAQHNNVTYTRKCCGLVPSAAVTTLESPLLSFLIPEFIVVSAIMALL